MPGRTVLIVDDHRSFAEALAIAIDLQEQLRCVAVVSTGQEALAAAARERPDVASVDMRLPDVPGAVLVRELRARHPSLAVLALTASNDAASQLAAGQAGAGAYLHKACTVQDVMAALLSVGTGTMTVGAGALSLVDGAADPLVPGSNGEVASIHLTRRERQVLDLLGAAADVRDIAEQLGISIHTARDHVKALLAKVGVHTQLALVIRARQVGLLGPTPPATPSAAVPEPTAAPARPTVLVPPPAASFAEPLATLARIGPPRPRALPAT